MVHEFTCDVDPIEFTFTNTKKRIQAIDCIESMLRRISDIQWVKIYNTHTYTSVGHNERHADD